MKDKGFIKTEHGMGIQSILVLTSYDMGKVNHFPVAVEPF